MAILSNLKASMAETSLILVDEMVLPDSHASWHATQLDLTMMASLASLERTQEHWENLLQSAGLKVFKIYPYDLSVHDSIIAAVPSEA